LQNKQKYLLKFSQKISGFKGFKIVLMSLFNIKSSSLTRDDIISLENKYALYSCDEKNHIKKTKKIFKKLWLNIVEIKEKSHLFSPIKKFM
jgi:hypothetical protein